MPIVEKFLSESNNYSEKTKQCFKDSLRLFFRFCPKNLEDITKRDVKQWLILLTQEGKAPSTVYSYLYSLKKFFGYCKEENILSVDPASGIKYPKLPKTLPCTFSQRELLEFFEASRSDTRDRAILEVLFTTGVRVSELINIKIEDIVWETRQIWVREGKGNKERFVMFTAECEERLKKYLATRKHDSPYLFVSRLGKPFSRQSIYKIVKKYVQAKGSPHTFRHTFATYLAEKGAPQEVIALLLGHKDYNSTSIYTNLTAKARKRLYDNYI
ncbi:MAG TPA: tyrosine-type recombinase/integrase [Syntrophomonadaceae bacterium]|nr:tyrosine-type recombinase/integrase [Syntrophomonadaceae bacterium]